MPLAGACGEEVDHFTFEREQGLMPHFGTPDEAASPVLGGETRERADEVAKLVFVGGTGRSGTHVLSQLISPPQPLRPGPGGGPLPHRRRRLSRPARRRGDAGAFVRRLRGFWWRGFQTTRFRGMYRFVDRERFDAAVDRFESDHDDLEAACRRLFYDLLWFRIGEGVREGEENPRGEALVEQSTDTVAAAPTLARLFPEARFIHVVRDGRDASASRVAQTRGLVRPRTRVQGIEWWEERIAAIERGADAIGEGRLLTVSLDELVRLQRARRGAAAVVPLPRRPGDQAHAALFLQPDDDRGGEQGALARGDLERKAERIDELYAAALERLEACGARCAPLLRHSLERRDDDLDPLVYVYDRGPR